MILTVDLGNSNLVLGGYRQGALAFTARMATDRRMEEDQYVIQLRGLLELHGVQPGEVRAAVLCSSAPPVTGRVEGALRRLLGMPVQVVAPGDGAGVRVCIDDPRELGADLLAAAAAVQGRWPMPCVIADLGTATTLTALDAEGAVCGVAIWPGVRIAQEALAARTSLPGSLPLEAPARAIGRNTADSMKSGAVLGAAAMLDGMIDRFEAELGAPVSVVATGGLAGLVAPSCRRRVDLRPELVLEGLYRIGCK